MASKSHYALAHALCVVVQVAATVGYDDPRSQWMLSLTHQGTKVNVSAWPSLNSTEMDILRQRAEGWFALATQGGDGGHIQWGQAFPQVQYANEARTVPARYDDVGDTAGWTGQLLSALAHKYAISPDKVALTRIGEILKGYNFSTYCIEDHIYLPRTWADPTTATAPFAAWHAYFSAEPSPTWSDHKVFNCTLPGFEHVLWQSDNSRDGYIGVIFGLASVLIGLEGKEDAATERGLAQQVFERIYDKLRDDKFFLVPPPHCPITKCPPVNPTPTMIAMLHRIALSANPAKYAIMKSAYDFWIGVAVRTESIVPIHHAGYYGNNLLSEVWHMISFFERRDKAAKHWSKVSQKMEQLCGDHSSHLQANLAAYWLTASSGAASPLFKNIVEAALWDFPSAPDFWRRVDQHNNTQYGDAVKCSESCGCAPTAMLVRDRPPNEFIWQIDPSKLSGGDDHPANQPETVFGGAFLTPYYIWQAAEALAVKDSSASTFVV